MKKFLVVFLIAIIVLIAMPMKTNATEPKPKFDTDIDIVPDIVTNKIILLSTDPVLLSALKKGTLGIVTFNNDRVVGFNVEGGYHYTTDFIIITEYPIDIKLTTPVGLKLQKGWLSVYFSKSRNPIKSWAVILTYLDAIGEDPTSVDVAIPLKAGR